MKVPGYLPEYDLNIRVRYPGTPEYFISALLNTLLERRQSLQRMLMPIVLVAGNGWPTMRHTGVRNESLSLPRIRVR